MPLILQAVLLATGIVVIVGTVLGVAGHFQQKRVRARLVAIRCPHCSRTFGSAILTTMRGTSYLWNPAPGFSVTQLGLPSGTFLITCPHCSTENEFTSSGEAFEPPKNGVDSFTRFVGGGSTIVKPRTQSDAKHPRGG
jgi:sarcosine oxidase delta subunit